MAHCQDSNTPLHLCALSTDGIWPARSWDGPIVSVLSLQQGIFGRRSGVCGSKSKDNLVGFDTLVTALRCPRFKMIQNCSDHGFGCIPAARLRFS